MTNEQEMYDAAKAVTGDCDVLGNVIIADAIERLAIKAHQEASSPTNVIALIESKQALAAEVADYIDHIEELERALFAALGGRRQRH